MTTKTAIFASLSILAAAVVVGLALLFFFSANPTLLGQGMAMLTFVPLLVIWVMWADQFRKEREKRKKGR
jgi:hypothetical protein